MLRPVFPPSSEINISEFATLVCLPDAESVFTFIHLSHSVIFEACVCPKIEVGDNPKINSVSAAIIRMYFTIKLIFNVAINLDKYGVISALYRKDRSAL